MPFGLPNLSTADAAERLQKAATKEIEINAEAAAQAATLLAANTAMNAFIRALPPPVSAGVTTLSEGMYTALKAKTFSIDLERAKRQTGLPERDIDPLKLFAMMIAFAIIQALWCFIKSILHPLPIIGWFFSLCDEEPPKIKDQDGNLVNDTDQMTLNQANRNFANPDNIDQIPTQVNPTPEVINIPQSSKGKTFDEFMAEKYPSSQASNQNNNISGAGNVNLVSNPQNTQNNSSNIEQPSGVQGIQISYEASNLSSDQARRLFGL